jgi:general secretion pathway protein D
MFASLASGSQIKEGALTDDRENSLAIPRIHAAFACAFMAFALTGCYKRSVLPQSEGHVTTPAAKPMLADIPAPARIADFVPPPKPAVKAPTYSVVVNEVPVKELLLALARDTKQNIDIHPGIEGLVSLNAINETLPAILDRISRQVPIRVRQTGNAIEVMLDTPYSKTYRINYVNMIRNSNSITSVSGRIGAGAQSSGAQGGSTGTQQQSTTSVTTSSANDFWKMLDTSIRGIVSSSMRLTKEEKNERLTQFREEQKIRLEDARAAAAAVRGASGATVGSPQAADTSTRMALSAQSTVSQAADDVIVNPIAGTITVSATEYQHNLVQAYLTQVQNAAQRQVLIEATIVEVTLSDQYQAGVDWSRLAISGGITLQQSMLGGNLGTPPAMAIGYTNPTSTIGNIAASIKLLNQFGRARVLSSPKLMALNNQTALLKVVDDLVYFNIDAKPAILLSGTAGAAQATFTTTALTVEVGVVMSLTPQINENGEVMLGVRPSITRLLSFVNDPNPALATAGVTSPVPQLQKREMESVLRLMSGQTAVLGGLMQDSNQYNRNSVPGAGNAANTGTLSEIFGYRNDTVSKSELVIFLRPTVVTMPSLESDELKFFQRFLPQQTDAPTEIYPGETTGVRK